MQINPQFQTLFYHRLIINKRLGNIKYYKVIHSIV